MTGHSCCVDATEGCDRCSQPLWRIHLRKRAQGAAGRIKSFFFFFFLMWTILKVFIEFATILLLSYVLVCGH